MSESHFPPERRAAAKQWRVSGINYCWAHTDGPTTFLIGEGVDFLGAALAELDRQDAEIERLRAENAVLRNTAADAEARIRLAREALAATGYFKGHEVGPDVAPRVAEYGAAVRAQVARLRAALSPFAAAAGDLKAAYDDACPLLDAMSDYGGFGPLSELTCEHLRAAKAAIDT